MWTCKASRGLKPDNPFVDSLKQPVRLRNGNIGDPFVTQGSHMVLDPA